jgi:hypothetical protein
MTEVDISKKGGQLMESLRKNFRGLLSIFESKETLLQKIQAKQDTLKEVIRSGASKRKVDNATKKFNELKNARNLLSSKNLHDTEKGMFDYLADAFKTTKKRDGKEYISTYSRWSEEEVKFIIKNSSMNISDLASELSNKFGRFFSYRSVQNKRLRLK